MFQVKINSLNTRSFTYSSNQLDKSKTIKVVCDDLYLDFNFKFEKKLIGKQLDDKIDIQTKIFFDSKEIFFESHETPHRYIGEDREYLCLLPKSILGRISLRDFLEKILVNYVIGYLNLREFGHWPNEDKHGNAIEIKRMIKSDLEILKDIESFEALSDISIDTTKILINNRRKFLKKQNKSLRKGRKR